MSPCKPDIELGTPAHHTTTLVCACVVLCVRCVFFISFRELKLGPPAAGVSRAPRPFTGSPPIRTSSPSRCVLDAGGPASGQEGVYRR